ncbi:MAG: 3-deoxy-D-manno-octulosonic acid transferase [Flavobacteriales bacterium]|nr:3-deoxy-D-manno-octulosonic acid transferase [Flavobacteriales bacterium]
MPLLYDIGLALYHSGIRTAALFNPKARAWVDGRKGTWERLEAKHHALRGCLWMHCASVGEFEQGRPVLEALKKERPELPVLITFFSPSGYEARKDFALATHVEYLPADGAANAKRFVDLVQPKAVLWVKYEFWYQYLHALKSAAVPTFLISALFRREQPFFRWYGRAYRSMLRCFSHAFIQDEASRDLLASIGVRNVDVSGDTRFDRVAEIAAANEALPIAASFKGTDATLVCGSTWPADETILLEAFALRQHGPKCILVPHEIDVDRLKAIGTRFQQPIARWSDMEPSAQGNSPDARRHQPSATLLVDRMGLLARLYKYADIAYVGGGFGDGIHSLLEAAAWGKPVIFGPNHRKFAEARGLIEAAGGFEVNNASELQDVLDRLLTDPAALAMASEAAARYVRNRVGATARIVSGIRTLVA